MKFLLLFILIACGSKTPSPDEYTKDDVDSEIDSYGLKADQRFKTFNPMSVSMKIGDHRSQMSNSYLYEEALKHLLVSRPFIVSKNYFSEWSYLRLPKENRLLEMIQQGQLEDLTDIELDFGQVSIQPYSLTFVNVYSTRFLGTWSQKMSLQLTKQEALEIALGHGFIKMNKLPLEEKFLDNLKESTVRLHLKDRVIYASHDTSLNKMLKANGIESFVDLSTETSYLVNENDKEEYWLRKIGPNEYAAGKFSSRVLKEDFLNISLKKTRKIQRQDGSMTKVGLQSSVANAAYFQIQPKQIVRNFNRVKGYSAYGSFGREMVSRNCDYHTISHVSNSTLENISLQDLKDSLKIDSPEPIEDLTFTEVHDSRGKYWEVYFKTQAKEFDVTLADQISPSSVDVGIVESSCPHIENKTQNLRVEESLTLTLTSFNSFTR
jgi:hypothetical protein